MTTKNKKPSGTKIRSTKAQLLTQLQDQQRIIDELQSDAVSASLYIARVEFALEMVSMACAVSSEYVFNDMQQKRMAAKLEEMIRNARSKPSVANWAFNAFTFNADGISFSVTPIDDTQTLSKTAVLRPNGKERTSTTAISGKVTVNYRLPIIGEVEVTGDVVHVESTTDSINTSAVSNKLSFWIEVEGIKREFTLETRGELYEANNFAYSVSLKTEAGIDRTMCDLGNNCREVHEPGETFSRPVGFDATIEMKDK